MKKKLIPPLPEDVTLNSFLEAVLEMLHELKNKSFENDLYYDSADVKQLLKISDSTLNRIRKSQSIPCVKIGKKIYYPKSFFNKAFKQ